MNNEQRKIEIRRRLKISKYPRRTHAEFTAENDHNPLVLADCPRCHGRGEVCRREQQGDAQTASIEVCSFCSGSGITEAIVRYFENDAPAIDVEIGAIGWIKCPCCGWKFTIEDSNVWTGRRHKRCGQKLSIA